MKLFTQIVDTPIGKIRVYANDKSLKGIFFSKTQELSQDMIAMNIDECELIKKTNTVIKKLEKQLKQYFAGKRKQFELQVDISGTEFQIKAWQALLKIPYGQSLSYKDQIKLMKTKSSGALGTRAVGSANGKNPFPIIIPCHRVVRANGDLGGYSGGLKAKKFLLALESKISH